MSGVERGDELGDLGILGVVSDELTDGCGGEQRVVPELYPVEVEGVLEALASEVGEVVAERCVCLLTTVKGPTLIICSILGE